MEGGFWRRRHHGFVTFVTPFFVTTACRGRIALGGLTPTPFAWGLEGALLTFAHQAKVDAAAVQVDAAMAAFEKARAEGRAALVGYLPAGFPSVPGGIAAMQVLVDAGCDVIEVGLPYSDPVMVRAAVGLLLLVVFLLAFAWRAPRP